MSIFRLYGNPVCAITSGQNLSLFCGSDNSLVDKPRGLNKTVSPCRPQSCPTTEYYEYVPAFPDDCFCALPFGVALRLRSPSLSDFPPYRLRFENYIAENVQVNLSQLDIDSISWEKRRLRIYLKFFPSYSDGAHTFSNDEVQRIANMFATFNFAISDEIFGPYDLLDFTLPGPYANGMSPELMKLSMCIALCFTSNKFHYVAIIIGHESHTHPLKQNGFHVKLLC